MNETTLGRRIAQRRRMLSLSQEAFGEKMGVSRQAISKWEADAAIPEVDRLVQMSKLFGVSVGWLLGAEEEKEEAPAADTIGLAEKILSTLQPPDPQPLPEPQAPPSSAPSPAPRKTNWLGIGCLALSLISLLLSALCLTKLRTIPTAPDPSAELEALSQKISQLEEAQRSSDELLRDTRQWIASLIDPSSGTTGSLASYENLPQWSLTAQLTGDLTHAQVTFRATASPIPSSAQLIVQQESQVLAKADCTLAEDGIQAQVELPVTDGCEYLLMLYDQEGIAQMLTLQGHGLEDLEALSQPQLHILDEGNASTFDNHSTELFWIGWEDIYLSASPLIPAEADLRWKDLAVCYYYNDTFLVSHDLTDQLSQTARDLHFSCPTLTYQMGGFQEGDLHELRLEGTIAIDGSPTTFSLPLICYQVSGGDLIAPM